MPRERERAGEPPVTWQIPNHVILRLVWGCLELLRLRLLTAAGATGAAGAAIEQNASQYKERLIPRRFFFNTSAQ